MIKKTKDIAASVRVKLRNLAKSSHRDFDAVLLQYFQERFLYRVSCSEFKENLILKGALLLMVKSISPFRPTKDIDFLGNGVIASPEKIKELVDKIIKVQCDDGVQFVNHSIKAEAIKEDADYEGVRVKLETKLGNIRKILTLDIGFGDRIYGGPEEFEFPVLLDFPSPNIRCYNYETIIAEKFQAIVWLNFQTSRMKDFFDIIFLARVNHFKAVRLRNAINTTFDKRGTRLTQREAVFSDEFKNDASKQTQWTAFLRKNSLIEYMEFYTIVDQMEKFLEPILQITIEKLEDLSWNCETWNWDYTST